MAKKIGAIDLFTKSIESTLNIRFFLIPLLAFGLGIAAGLISLVVLVPFLIAGLLVPTMLAPMAIVGFLVFLAVIFVASAIIEGFYLSSVDEFLEKEKVSVEKNIRHAFARWPQLTGVYIVQFIVVAVLVMAIIMPFILFGLMPLIQENPAAMQVFETGTETEVIAALAPAIGILAFTIIAIAAISIFIAPLMFMWFPEALFEKKSLRESIRKGYEHGKKRYMRNLGALLLMGLLGIVISGIYAFDQTGLIGLILSLWIELASSVMVVKVYREK